MKKAKFLAVCLIGMTACTGCSFSPELNLTAEQEQQIVNYSAGLLLKYSEGYQQTLVDTTEKRELQAKVEALKAQQQAQKENGKSSASGESGALAASPYEQKGEQDLAAALSQSGIEIAYSGYEVAKSYSPQEELKESLALDATNGRNLFVFHFQVSNVTENDAECNILEQEPIFRIIVNGEDRKNAFRTLLPNDLTTLKETIPAQESVDAVLIMEADEGYEQEIQTISLLLKAGENESVIPLQ